MSQSNVSALRWGLIGVAIVAFIVRVGLAQHTSIKVMALTLLMSVALVALTRLDRSLKRRATSLLWIIAVAAVTIELIYSEQTALLYVISTVGVTVLLVVVAKANLSGRESAEW